MGITQTPCGSHALQVALHLLSYVLGAYFLFANRRLTGVPLVAIGAPLNVLAITANGGVMPANAAALRIAGIAERAGFDNLVALTHPHLAFLGDVIPVPGPWPTGNVLSVGDLVIPRGAFVVLHCGCGPRWHRVAARFPAQTRAMREVRLPESELPPAAASFLACLATILELPFEDLPLLCAGEDPTGWKVSRWLGGLGLGLARVAEPASFSWPGPWIAHAGGRFVVMYGVPSGVVWDPAGGPEIEPGSIEEGLLVAAADIALARPARPAAPTGTGVVESLAIAGSAGEPARLLEAARALAGQGIEGDRHVAGTGTFPSGMPGSALTMIEAEVCESFDPPLDPSQHRRNLVTRGIDLNALVGYEFTIGEVRCRGMRLCEPCTVVQRYAGRPVLRALVHRGGLRADILHDGTIRVGDPVRAAPPGGRGDGPLGVRASPDGPAATHPADAAAAGPD